MLEAQRLTQVSRSNSHANLSLCQEKKFAKSVFFSSFFPAFCYTFSMMNNTTNPSNSNLDPQNESHRFAHVACNEVNEYRDDSFDSRYESADEGGSDEPHMYPDDGDYDPSSDF